ncbi:ATP-binding protein [Enterobacter hormaechei]
MSLSTFLLKCLGPIGRIVMPKAKQIYAEHTAGNKPDEAIELQLDKFLNEALGRLGVVDDSKPWWSTAMNALGKAAVQPESFKRPHIQKWLTQQETQYLLKQLIRDKLTGNEYSQESLNILVSSYIEESFESKQYAISIITTALAVLEASVLGSIKDKGTAAIVQAYGDKQLEFLSSLRENLNHLIPDDIRQIVRIAQNNAESIQCDIGGIQIERTAFLQDINNLIKSVQFIQVRGLPGSGKSVLLKQLAQQALDKGPVLFLRAEQLEGKSWFSYASTQGLSAQPLFQLLSQIEKVGTPVIFIDAIDRTEKEQQPIILDIIRTIIQSPELANWRIVASLRDTSVDALQHWLGDTVNGMTLGTVSLNNLSNEEAETLAAANPLLRSLLFSSTQLEDIVRRPFFAKVLHQNYTIDPQSTFQPRSEVDLIAQWWQRGGYNETGQFAVERQRQLIELAKLQAHALNKPIKMNQLSTMMHIDAMKSDGLLDSVRDGISVRFTHDIFFEWAFLHVIAECEERWVDEIRSCGEPPALARTIELAAQWEYNYGENWAAWLALTQSSGLRTQWLRAWLLGPLGLPDFAKQQDPYTRAIFADGCQLFKKALVWFQATKITPNESINTFAFPSETQQQYAYLVSWPSDYLLWRRFIEFILAHISIVPKRLYPDILAVFEVWQNVFFCTANPITHKLLLQCNIWLNDIDNINYRDNWNANSFDWHEIPELEKFRKSLRRLIFLSSKAEPEIVSTYLLNSGRSNTLRRDVFDDVLTLCPILAQSPPSEIVNITLACLKEELPEERLAREAAENKRDRERRITIQAKPESERTSQEQAYLNNFSLFTTVGVSHYDWDRLCLDDGFRNFYPPTPRREPFQSLFQHSPNEALALVRELCNHATMAWRQMHTCSRDTQGTPIPLELTFCWGHQKFWGNAREFQWFRAARASHVIGCALMALEQWCYEELMRARPLDDLLEQVVIGHDNIAILGVAAMLTLHTKTVSPATLPLLTSQRVLSADQQRMHQDLISCSGMFSSDGQTDPSLIGTTSTASIQPERQQTLTSLISSHFIKGDEYSDILKKNILSFTDNLPFEYEELRDRPECISRLRTEALKYAELVDWNNYNFHEVENRPDLIAVSHTSSFSSTPESLAKRETASKFINATRLLSWCLKCLEKKALLDTFSIPEAIAVGRQIDTSDVMIYSADESEETHLAIYRGALSAIAAVILTFRQETTPSNIHWARDILMRVLKRKEIKDTFWTPDAITIDHPAIFAAQGLAAELRENAHQYEIARSLLILITHPLKAVTLAALKEACDLWSTAPKLTWVALVLAFSRNCASIHSLQDTRKKGDINLPSPEAEIEINALLELYEGGSEWPKLPLIPAPWVKRNNLNIQNHNKDNPTESDEEKNASDIIWLAADAAKALSLVPVESIMASDRKEDFLIFLQSALNWTVQEYEVNGEQSKGGNYSRHDTFEWSQSLGTTLSLVAGLIPFSSFNTRFLIPILEIEDSHCLELLYPLVNGYVCHYVYDALTIPSDTVIILNICLDRFLKLPEFDSNSFLKGKLNNFQYQGLIDALMFVSVEKAEKSARYANGDWSELPLILPVIDHFIRAVGGLIPIMERFLTLCERAKVTYPADMFADQIISVLNQGPDSLQGWHSTLLLERIAALVEYFAHRNTPMSVDLSQKLLRILDVLVDMGDRRSSLLQLNESFRDIRL